MKGKGAGTRHVILERATALVTRDGLDGLTIGQLAEDLQMSKSGLFAHFRSKEALEVAVLEFAVALFVEKVIRPALAAPRGEPRLRDLYDRWLAWERTGPANWCGCPFVAAAVEVDDRPGPARDTLVKTQRDWLNFIAGAVRIGMQEGHFHAGADPEQAAQEIYGMMLGYHHISRLLGDPDAEQRARRAFDALLDRIRRDAVID
jgi:AcrR family transcriptional regulator